MNVEVGTGYMPYAPARPVLEIIRRMRDGRLPEPLSVGALQQLGVAEGNADRVQKALLFLRLIGDDLKRTDLFNRLGRVSTEEYPNALAEVVQAAYAPILQIVKPGEDSDIAVNDAFRGYEPSGQRPRMVGLFYALCREAGLMSGGPVERAPRPRKANQPSSGAFRPKAAPAGESATSVPPESALHEEVSLQDYRLIANLIQQLPKDGKWTQTRRDRWIQAMTASVDLLVEVEEVVP